LLLNYDRQCECERRALAGLRLDPNPSAMMRFDMASLPLLFNFQLLARLSRRIFFATKTLIGGSTVQTMGVLPTENPS
jgi:hypothetical protein